MNSKLASPFFVLGITVLCAGGIPSPAVAQVHVEVGIGIPTPFVFAAPPQLVILPGSSIYVVPDLGEDLYYYDGWWWRPWQGHWYRSHYYDHDWDYYESVPSFYGGVPHDWRHRYQNRQWDGRPWNYERVTPDRLGGSHDRHQDSEGSRSAPAPAVRESAPRTHSQEQAPRAISPKQQGHPSQPSRSGSGSHKTQAAPSSHQAAPSSHQAPQPHGQGQQQPGGGQKGQSHGAPAKGQDGGQGSHGGPSGK